MQIDFIKPKDTRGKSKITVHKTGKMGFSRDADKLINLSKFKFAKFGYGVDESFYMVMSENEDEATFKISKAGEYYYVMAKSLLKDIDVDYKSKNTTIFDIEKTIEENVYKLNKRVIMKE